VLEIGAISGQRTMPDFGIAVQAKNRSADIIMLTMSILLYMITADHSAVCGEGGMAKGGTTTTGAARATDET
jgi:hypothetical protein